MPVVSPKQIGQVPGAVVSNPQSEPIGHRFDAKLSAWPS